VARRLLAIANALDGIAGRQRRRRPAWIGRRCAIGDRYTRTASMSARPLGRRSTATAGAGRAGRALRHRDGGTRPGDRGVCAFTREDLVADLREAVSTRPCIARRWVGCCAAWACRDRRRAPATRRRHRPRRRPLKRAPQLLNNFSVRINTSACACSSRTRPASARRVVCAASGGSAASARQGLCDRRFTFAYIFAAVEPGTDNAFALVLPYANTEAMQVFLDQFAATIGQDEHVV